MGRRKLEGHTPSSITLFTLHESVPQYKHEEPTLMDAALYWGLRAQRTGRSKRARYLGDDRPGRAEYLQDRYAVRYARILRRRPPETHG